MLTVTLFGAIFSSVIWLVYAFRFVSSSLSGMSFFDAGILNVLLYTLFVCLPVFLLWAVFGFISQYIHNRTVGRQMFKLFSQMKKNQDYSDLLARIMLETEQNIKNSFVLSRFDLLIADMNELLSEFILRERLASMEQIEQLWTKVQNGGKWSFGKVVIENYNRQPAFQKKVFESAAGDNLLAGTIMEFCARYQTLLTLLEKHDKEKVFLNIVETGVLGKVFAVLAPVADELRRSREAFSGFASAKPATLHEELKQKQPSSSVLQVNTPFTDETPKTAESKKSLISRLMPGRKASPDEVVQQKDAFSLALERSFGEDNSEDTAPDTVSEPVFEISSPVGDDVPSLSGGIEEELVVNEEVLIKEKTPPVSDTQKTLDSLKKEWQEIDTKTDKTDDDLTYPFGGWTDAGNYQK